MSLLVTTAAQANMLTNGDFEQGTGGYMTAGEYAPDGWTMLAGASAWHQNNPPEGVQDLQSIVFWNSDNILAQDFAVTSGSTYDYSVEVINITAGPLIESTVGSLVMYAEALGAGDAVIDTVEIDRFECGVDPSGEWTAISGEYTVPEAAVTGRIYFVFEGASGATHISFDNASVVPNMAIACDPWPEDGSTQIPSVVNTAGKLEFTLPESPDMTAVDYEVYWGATDVNSIPTVSVATGSGNPGDRITDVNIPITITAEHTYYWKVDVNITSGNPVEHGLKQGALWWFQSVAYGGCPSFESAVSAGNVEQGQTVLINEASGIAASNSNANIFWVNNDSGDYARIYAINQIGQRVGTYNLTGAIHYDYEDIAVGPGPVAGQEYIYISDTGDNYHGRSSGYYPITVYRVAEPLVDSEQSPVTVNLSGVDALPMRYPSTVYGCETLLVDPVSGDIFLVTRDRRGEGFAYVYRNPAPHTPGVLVTLELIATIACGTEIKGGAISPYGNMIILKPHSFYYATDALLWPRPDSTALGDAFSQSPCSVSVVWEPQGEAICFDADGCGYYTVSEGTNQPLYYYARQGPCLLAGDFEPDGDIDLADIQYFVHRWLMTGCQAPDWCEGADLDHIGGKVDLLDFAMLAENWLDVYDLNDLANMALNWLD